MHGFFYFIRFDKQGLAENLKQCCNNSDQRYPILYGGCPHVVWIWQTMVLRCFSYFLFEPLSELPSRLAIMPWRQERSCTLLTSTPPESSALRPSSPLPSPGPLLQLAHCRCRTPGRPIRLSSPGGDPAQAHREEWLPLWRSA